MKLKINKTWIVLGVALVVGGGAAFMANSYLRAQVEEIESRGKGESVKLVVAKKDMPKGTTWFRFARRPHGRARGPNDAARRAIRRTIAARLRTRKRGNRCCGRSSKAIGTQFSARVAAGRAQYSAVDEISHLGPCRAGRCIA